MFASYSLECILVGDLIGRTSSEAVQGLTPNNDANSPQFPEPLKFDTANHDGGADSSEHGGAVQEEQKFEDPLHKFLPPPSKAKCSEELQVLLLFFFPTFKLMI